MLNFENSRFEYRASPAPYLKDTNSFGKSILFKTLKELNEAIHLKQ